MFIERGEGREDSTSLREGSLGARGSELLGYLLV